MKKYLLALLLLLSPALASAQNSNWYVPPWLQSSNTSGTTLSGPLLLPDGSVAAPALAFANDTTLGVWRGGANYLTLTSGGQVRLQSGTSPSATFILSANGALGSRLKIGQGSLEWTASNADATTDVVLARDAANTLAQRNSTNAQQFNLYETYADSSNYARLEMVAEPGMSRFLIASKKLGTGSSRNLVLFSSGASVQLLAGAGAGWELNTGGSFFPITSETFRIGGSANLIAHAYISHSIQGSKTKDLTESSATAVTQIAVPQTAGANYADARIEWVVYATDGTDSQTLKGASYLTAVNKAGTETCTVGAVGTAINAVSAGTLTCTASCITGLTDAVQFALNCVSSLTQTTFTARARLDMMQPNTVTPQ